MTKEAETAKETIDLVATVSRALSDAANSHGDKVVELTLEGARIIAIQNVIEGIILLPIVFFFGFLFVKSLILVNSSIINNTRSVDTAAVALMTWLYGIGTFLFFLLLLSAVNLPNIYGMFKPEVYITTKVIRKVL